MTAKKEVSRHPKIYTDEVVIDLMRELVRWLEEDEERFWIKDFAIMKKFPSDYFRRWAKEIPECEDLMRRAKDIQETRLLKGALDKKKGWNFAFVIFVLKNVAGYKDKQEVVSTEPTTWYELMCKTEVRKIRTVVAEEEEGKKLKGANRRKKIIK
ncbi:MAG: hypothetical protein ACTSQY_10840 [Candidatus Odinarchaeia archaeon]